MPDPAAAADLADHLRPALLKLSRHLRREAQNVGASPLDAQLLGMIGKRPGIGVSELAALEHMSRPTMSVRLKRLEAEGWLERAAEAADADRRRVSFVLSRAGEQALAAIRRSRNDWLEARLGRLAADERSALAAAIEPLARLAEMKL